MGVHEFEWNFKRFKEGIKERLVGDCFDVHISIFNFRL